MFLDRNNFWIGILVGLVVPFVGFAIWLTLFDQFTEMGWMSTDGFSLNWRRRTTGLLAICMNLIPFHLYNRRRYTTTMRGIILPTVAYSAAWFIYYGYYLVS
ncbi:MAG: hypothetical protein AB8G15_18965 [Saprospiraceae bacterium]